MKKKDIEKMSLYEQKEYWKRSINSSLTRLMIVACLAAALSITGIILRIVYG